MIREIKLNTLHMYDNCDCNSKYAWENSDCS